MHTRQITSEGTGNFCHTVTEKIRYTFELLDDEHLLLHHLPSLISVLGGREILKRRLRHPIHVCDLLVEGELVLGLSGLTSKEPDRQRLRGLSRVNTI